MSSLTEQVCKVAIIKTTQASTSSISIIRKCPVGNKQCSTENSVLNRTPVCIVGEFGWKKCNLCNQVIMDKCCNDLCHSNDSFKRMLSPDIEEVERANTKFVHDKLRVLCSICGVHQPRYDEFIDADLSKEDESGNRYYDDEEAHKQGIMFHNNTYAHKRNDHLVDSLQHEENENTIKTFFQSKKRKKETKDAPTKVIHIICSSDSTDETFKKKEVTEEEAKKALLENINGGIRGSKEYKILKQVERLITTIAEEENVALSIRVVKDVALSKRIAKVLSNFKEYFTLFHDSKALPNSKSLKLAVAVTHEMCSTYRTTFVYYQRIYDVCFGYSDAEDVGEEQPGEEEDKNAISLGKYLQVCQSLGISYKVSDILKQEFLMSACTYLINKVRDRRNKMNDPTIYLQPSHVKKLQKRASSQISMYTNKADLKAVELSLQSEKSEEEKVESTALTTTGLGLSIIIPAVLLSMACEKLLLPCIFHISANEMAEIINYSPSTLSQIKAKILISKDRIASDKKKSTKKSLHDTKKGWVLTRIGK